MIIDLLSNINIPIKWIHIGDGELYSYIKEFAERKLSKESFKFLGKIDNEKILSTYVNEDVDFLINMSDSEGLPVSMMEAFSMGIPVIARNVGGISEIISKECGCLIQREDDVYLKANDFFEIRLNNPALYKRISSAAYEKWLKLFNAQTNYSDFIEKIK